MQWPAQSPDLNPIENLLPELNRLTKDRKPKNEDGHFEMLKSGWNEITDEYLNKLVESMPSRCKAVIKSKECQQNTERFQPKTVLLITVA